MARILLANKFYYPRGGDCIAVLNLEKLLKQHNHEVAIFSSQHPQNLESIWSNYFPSEISFASTGLKNRINAAARLFYDKETKEKFNRLLSDFKPDIVHVHNIHSYLSPYIVKIAAQKEIKIVWTLHDYKLICPSYSCLKDGKTCELCLYSKWPVIRHKCMKKDIKASMLAYLEAEVWNRRILEKYTNTFISPSQFLKSKMASGGFQADKIKVLSNFFPQSVSLIPAKKEDYYCYVGRLSREKGIDLLMDAARQLPYSLKIIGGGERLKEYQSQFRNSNIEFLGYLSNDAALQVIREARFSIIPSVWYENNPLSVIESLCVGTPVIGAAIGGIPELIEEGRNGLLFLPNNADMLKNKIIQGFHTFKDINRYKSIAEEASLKFSADVFYKKLMGIYGL